MSDSAGSAVRPDRVQAWHWVVLAAAWFATMGWRPLLEPDEGRYAEIPREMSVTGDWVTPRLNGIKYFEKPPLQYWATAALDSVFGSSEWSGRFWSCALAFLCIPLAFAFARHVHGTVAAGIGAATVLAVSPYFAIVGQLNLLDSGLTFFMTASMFAYLRAGSEAPGSSRERRWMVGCSLALAFAILSKGIVALVLAGGTLVIHAALTRQIRAWCSWHLPVTVPVLALVTVPWFIAVSARNPEFPEFFFIHEHFARYLTDVSDRVQPWWFFLPMLFLAMVPFLVPLMRTAKRTWLAGLRAPANSGNAFLWVWCGFVFLFFSASHSKLPTYILPMLPALAVLMAPELVREPRQRSVAAWIALAVVALVALVIPAIAWRKFAAIPDMVAAGALVAILVAVIGAGFARRHWLTPVIAILLAFQALIVSYSALPPVRTAKELVAAVRSHIGSETALFSVQQYRQSIPPYLGRTVRLALYQGELEFGISQEKHLFMATLDEFIEAWVKERNAVAFVEPSLISTLQAREVPLRQIARDDRTVAISRQ